MDGKIGYTALMHEVCVVSGWCGGLRENQTFHVDLLIPKSGTVTADQFVEWLFEAEGIDLHARSGHWDEQRRSFREAFVRHMGSDAVDAARLTWS